MSALLKMQGCCPHQESPSLPRKIAAGVFDTNSFQEMVLRFRNRNTGLPANCSFCDHDCLRKTLSSKAAVGAAIYDCTGFWVGGLVAYGGGSFQESSSPLKCTGQCGAIHTAPFRASEAGSLAPGISRRPPRRSGYSHSRSRLPASSVKDDDPTKHGLLENRGHSPI